MITRLNGSKISTQLMEHMAQPNMFPQQQMMDEGGDQD
jgi:hypothetical protein